MCSRDRVTLTIDTIDKAGDPDDVMNLNIGDQVEFHLKYSSRVAKLRADILPTCRQREVFKAGSCIIEGCEGSTCAVSSPRYAEKPAEDEVTEKILPGLKKIQQS